MDVRLIRTPALYLVGFMGSGKSTVGRLLADELGWNFVDLDEDIEAAAGATIAEVFENQGEGAFRQLEHEALRARVRRVQSGKPAVLALGGGAFIEERNLALVADNGISIWLDCPLERLRVRIEGQTHRPLARDPAKFAQLFQARQPGYARADFRIAIEDDDPAVAARQIIALPIFD